MSYRDSHVNFEECLRRGEAQALADRTSSLAPVNELGGALAEMARAVRLTRLSWRWWRASSDDAYGLGGNQYGPFPPGTDCKITYGRDGDIGTIRYVGPNSWSCAGDDFGSAREALARMLTLPDTASTVRMYQIGVAEMHKHAVKSLETARLKTLAGRVLIFASGTPLVMSMLSLAGSLLAVVLWGVGAIGMLSIAAVLLVSGARTTTRARETIAELAPCVQNKVEGT